MDDETRAWQEYPTRIEALTTVQRGVFGAQTSLVTEGTPKKAQAEHHQLPVNWMTHQLHGLGYFTQF